MASNQHGEWQVLREIVLDTETTGLDAKNGDRLIDFIDFAHLARNLGS